MNNDPENEDELQETATNRLKQTAQQATNELRGQLSSMGDNVAEKASGMLGAAKEKLGSMSESARTAASAARERAGELLGDARESAHEAYERARDRVSHWGEDGLQYVRDNPAKSVFTALLAGVVLGFTLRRH
jgi:ElaB/YqjD/DUF883 family membrane-anchored ribosome-binding protein